MIDLSSLYNIFDISGIVKIVFRRSILPLIKLKRFLAGDCYKRWSFFKLIIDSARVNAELRGLSR